MPYVIKHIDERVADTLAMMKLAAEKLPIANSKFPPVLLVENMGHLDSDKDAMNSLNEKIGKVHTNWYIHMHSE